MKPIKKNGAVGRCGFLTEKGVLEAKLSKLKEHMQEDCIKMKTRFFDSKDSKLRNYAKVLNKKQNISKSQA